MTTTAADVLPTLVAKGALAATDPALTTTEMQAAYTVHAFAAPFVLVTRNADNQRGTLQFSRGEDGIRYYYAWVAE